MATKPTPEDRYEELEEELKELVSDITKVHKAGTEYLSNPSKYSIFKAYLSRLDDTYDKFNARLNELKRVAKLASKKTDGFPAYREKVQNIYYETLSMGIPKEEPDQSKLESSRMNKSEMGQSFFKLPTINLPSFNGDVFEWPCFKDTFVSLIHENPDLSPVQKFHYLKSSLKGSATQVIATIPIIDNLYPQAWALLCKRYDNKRIQATNYLMRIFNFKPLNKGNIESLENFSSVVLESANAFINLKLEDPAGFILTTFAMRLLDPKTKDLFENKFGDPNALPNLKVFSEFLHHQNIRLQTSVLNNPPNPHMHTPSTSKMNKGTVLMSINVNRKGQCSLCKETHRLINCQNFLKLSPNQRFEKVKNWNRCVNCFAMGHSKNNCPSSFSCRFCQRRHHSLLHNDHNYARKVSTGNQGSRPPTQNSPVENKSISSVPTQPKAHNIISNHTSSNNGPTSSSKETTKILLATARARIRGKNGHLCSVRILIDSGSQRSFVTADCAKRLNLPRIHNTQRLVGLGQQTIAGGNQQIAVTIIPENREEPEFFTNAIIMDRICENIPNCKIANNVTQYLKLDHLADPTYCEPGPIDFLLGADLFGEIFLGDTVTLPDGFPRCYNTVFGWVFMGKVLAPTPKSDDLALCVINPESENLDLKVLVEKFWTVEEVDRVPRIDPLDAKCEEHFKITHSRDPTGRYVVELPFKDSCPQLGNSKTGAITRFHKLEQRLSKDPNLKSKYNQVFSEYLENDYLSPAQELGKFYLPHQAVLKNDVSKIRVVFDASHSTSTGSLNDKLIQGPKLQTDIKDILLRFRNPRFAIATDICQMYSQILVQDKDRAYQHLYFRFDPNDAIVDYTFNRVTFGMTCSPYIALRVVQQLVIDEGSPFPLASKALGKNIYMPDIASRGTNPTSLTSDNAWWSGAEWQSLPKDEWPVTPIRNHSVEDDLPETKDVALLVSSKHTANPEELVKDFSSFPRMLRVFSYMRRWKMLIRGQKKLGAVSLGEIQQTLDQVVREIQKHHFQGNYAVKYKSLVPFVDTHGIVRVGGRLQNAPIPFEAKHPILLPYKSDFVNLLIDYLHVTYCHAGPQLLFSLIKRRYWIVSGRKLVRHRVHLCVRCHRLRATPYEYQMSSLPLTRFEQGRAFINVGVDFAGPFPIKESSRRKAALGKAYFGIFICMSTKAIHVELVSRLSTDAFLASLDRFIARRGLPSRIFSDNGRNFVGANRQLKELGRWLSEPDTQSQIAQHLCQREIQWTFIPPAAPHFGGLWEAAVKSLKFHLTRILDQQPLTYEELSTIAIRVEAVLNSRPLCPLSSDPDEFDVLTPGHFLIGEPLLALPSRDYTDLQVNSLSRWQFLQKCVEDLWRRWRSDYLSGLQQRVKWKENRPNIKKDTLVLMTDKKIPPLMWPIGRIIDIFPGQDGVIRVAKIRTPTGEYTRPIARLAPLIPQEASV